MKQIEAADAAGISRSTIQQLESGDRFDTGASITLQTFYESWGIEFVRPPTAKDGEFSIIRAIHRAG